MQRSQRRKTVSDGLDKEPIVRVHKTPQNTYKNDTKFWSQNHRELKGAVAADQLVGTNKLKERTPKKYVDSSLLKQKTLLTQVHIIPISNVDWTKETDGCLW